LFILSNGYSFARNSCNLLVDPTAGTEARLCYDTPALQGPFKREEMNPQISQITQKENNIFEV